MSRTVLLISYEPLVHRLKEHIERQYQKTVDYLLLPRSFFDEAPRYKIDEYVRYYEEICRYLEGVSPTSLRNFMVIVTSWVNFQNFEDWNPLLHYEENRERHYPPEVLLSWLVLTYPEIRWIFLNHAFSRHKGGRFKLHSLPPDMDLTDIFQPTSCIPLFDPCGLRNAIRENIVSRLQHDGRAATAEIPRRKLFAAAIDEEVNYAYMNAYTAYRFGYRAWAINTWQMLHSVFGHPGKKFAVVFEDLYLNFPDKPHQSSFPETQTEDNDATDQEIRLSNLTRRDTLLPAFQNVQHRVLVTVGPRAREQEGDIWNNNMTYLKSLKGKSRILFKPFAGIFDLWKGAGLFERERKGWHFFRKKPRQADDFDWPPSRSDRREGSDPHSAPGKLLIIAQRLIKRAVKILHETETVPDAIHAAVLALEAKELLASRTPTTAMEALAVQHQAEISAESMFYGIEYNLNVKDRFRDIAREVASIGYWFRPASYKKSTINARLTIVESLANRFRELNQFEEEHYCLAEARRLRFDFWLRQKWYHRPAWPFVKYTDFLLRSLWNLFAAVVLWLIVFAGVYCWGQHGIAGLDNIYNAFTESTAFFFTLEQVSEPGEALLFGSKNYWNLLLAVQGLVSFSTLGLFLTHFYMIISRK